MSKLVEGNMEGCHEIKFCEECGNLMKIIEMRGISYPYCRVCDDVESIMKRHSFKKKLL
ncbi:unnamed protein product, partial [marine sediment metagenome]